MILCNENFEVLGEGFAGGVNVNSTTAENSLENVKNCLDQVLGAKPPAVIDKVYVVFIGPVETLVTELEKRVTVRETIIFSEAEAAALAGALWEDGFVANAGTGADVFLVDKDRMQPKSGFPVRKAVGGWGPILGDQGSGVWIGQEAIRAVVSGIEGWTEKTLIYDLIRRDWGLKDDWDMVTIVHSQAAPLRKTASLTRQVEEAAKAGDKIALDIVKRAGGLMAAQALCLFRRYEIPPGMRRLVCCGGAWKTHPLMFETFKAKIYADYPDFDVRKPLFEHFLAGPALEMLRTGFSAPQAEKLLTEKFPDWVIRW
jgi:N-acetylglucosamine kinase-like BadF-type ATPase